MADAGPWILWVDGVGGYLVCPGAAVTLATPSSATRASRPMRAAPRPSWSAPREPVVRPGSRGRRRERSARMSYDNAVGLILAILVTAYLVYALVFPEKL